VSNRVLPFLFWGILSVAIALCIYTLSITASKPFLPARHVAFDRIAEGAEAKMDLQLTNPLSEAIIIRNYKVSCGCMAVESQHGLEPAGVRIDPFETIPLRVTLGTKGRYGKLPHWISFDMEGVDSARLIHAETRIDLEIEAGLRVIPDRIFFQDESPKEIRCLVYSGLIVEDLTHITVENNDSLSAKIVPLTELESSQLLESMRPIAAVVVNRPADGFRSKQLELRMKVAGMIFTQALLVEVLESKKQLIWPSKIYVSAADKLPLVRNIEVVCPEHTEVVVSNVPNGITLTLGLRKRDSQLLEVSIDDPKRLFSDSACERIRLTIGSQEQILEIDWED
jgi:hypothetical protein